MLELISGPDRTANTDLLLEQLCEKARSHVAGQIWIVPEQYSHETERLLAARGGDTISRYAEVLSFTRLAARVFSVYGGVCEEYLDDNGRILTLYLAARQVREQLKFYAAVMNRPDFLQQLGTLMEELLTACVQPDALYAAARQLDGRLAQKVTELALLYESYLSICKTGRADPVTRQARLCEQLEQTDFMDGREVYLDGFSDFTALQMQLLAAILSRAANVHITVLTSGGTQAACLTGNETKKRLAQLAARLLQPVRYTRTPPRAHRAPDVERCLYGLFFGGSGTPDVPQGVRLVRADSVSAACAWAARRIRTGAAEGLRFRDFTVCVTQPEEFTRTMQTLLARAGIPVYSAGSTPVLQTPLAAALLAALQAVQRYEALPVMSFLKSEYAPLSPDECDRLEQYVHYWKIHGQLWEKPWQQHPHGLGAALTEQDAAELEQLNALRERAIAPLRRLRLGLAQAKTMGGQVRAVADFWEQIGLAARLQAQSEALYEQQKPQQAQECGQLYEALISALEQMDRVLGQTEADTELFIQLLSMLLSGTSVGSIPAVCDAVQLTTLPMLRHRRTRVLLVLGADDGKLPAFAEPGGLLADAERQKLRGLGVELAAGRQSAAERELSWVCAALSAAEQELSFICTAEQPSFLYVRAQTLFPALRDESAQDAPFYPDCAAAAAAALRQPTLPDWLPQSVAREAGRLREHCGYGFEDLQPEAVQALYGKTVPLSASKLDCFALCRYAFFLQYGLRAKPWKQAEFDAPLYGSFVHAVLEQTVRQAQAQGGFAAMTDEQLEALTERCMDACMQTWLPQSGQQQSREGYLSRRIRQQTAVIVQDVARELRQSRFVPVAEELRFAPDGALAPIRYHTELGSGLLSGMIDRVDVCEVNGKAYFRIVDYKTGHKDFSYTELLYGRNLQMLLYLFALRADARAARGGALPAGVLYVPGRSDMVRLEPGEGTEQAEAEQRRLLRRKGLVLDDEAVLHAMEAYTDQPRYLPVQIKKDALCGDLASPAQLKLLEGFVTGQVETMLRALLSGKTAPNPVDHGPADSACRYCDYAAACHKDVCAVQPRRFAEVSAEQFWQELEGRQQHGRA